MRIGLLVILVLTATAGLPAWAVPNCMSATASGPIELPAIVVPAVSVDLPVSGRALGASDGVLAYAGNDALAADQVLTRLHNQACAPAAAAVHAPAASTGAYVPRTKWDNTPYRFSAGGNGKKFTAAEFDAWMAAKGIHIAKGVPQPATPAAPSAPSADTTTPQR